MNTSAANDWRQQLQGPVAVLLGGHSAERKISLQSGAAIITALQQQGIDCVAIDTAQSDWLAQVAASHRHVFIALHGGDGEDGTVQGALKNINVSYTGSGVKASALAMDKLRCKYMWQGMNLPTPGFLSLHEDCDWTAIIAQWGKVIVKPVNEGSSIGMAIATTAVELRQAFENARQFDRSVLAEQWVAGAEFTVAVLGAKTLPAIRLETDNSFYDYQAKYLNDDTRYFCPSGLNEAKERELQQLSLAAFNSVGCRGWGRVDVMQNSQGEFLLLEVNTVPGMTSHSLVPMAAIAADMSFDQLVGRILQLSVSEGGY